MVGIEEDYFVIFDKVLPIQKLIGDTKIIRLFNRDVVYTIKKNSVDSYTVDRIMNNLTQEIRVKFIEVVPEITEETLELYKKILVIEQNNLKKFQE
jgi:hypothetical protein